MNLGFIKYWVNKLLSTVSHHVLYNYGTHVSSSHCQKGPGEDVYELHKLRIALAPKSSHRTQSHSRTRSPSGARSQSHSGARSQSHSGAHPQPPSRARSRSGSRPDSRPDSRPGSGSNPH